MSPPIRVVSASAAQAADLTAAVAFWSAAALRRPLFRPDRRPLATDSAVTARLPRLSAVVITASSSAAIFSSDNGKAIVISAGGVIDGYRIATIRPGAVEITGPAGNRALHPQFAPAAQADAAAPSVTPPQRSLDSY
jgi:general secretion pathway protein N